MTWPLGGADGEVYGELDLMAVLSALCEEAVDEVLASLNVTLEGDEHQPLFDEDHVRRLLPGKIYSNAGCTWTDCLRRCCL